MGEGFWGMVLPSAVSTAAPEVGLPVEGPAAGDVAGFGPPRPIHSSGSGLPDPADAGRCGDCGGIGRESSSERAPLRQGPETEPARI